MSSKTLRPPVAFDLLVVLAAQLAVVLLVRESGFLAISDDDYARVVIAQKWVADPAWDPSGTSWLPFPFLHTGLALKLFESGLGVARAWATVTAMISASLLYVSGRIWGLSRVFSIVGAVACILMPYSAYLSAATVPEHLTGALSTFALTTLAHQSVRLRMLGGALLFLGCASRYETWPIAFGFAALSVARPPSGDRRGGAAAAIGAFSFPLVWMIHGVMNHDRALFFIKRVVDYKEALGGAQSSAWETAEAIPKALILAEPETSFALLGALSLLALGKLKSESHASWLLPWAPLGLGLATLIIGAIRSGAPTHHPERALFAFWLLGILTTVRLLDYNRDRLRLAAPIVVLYVALGIGARHAGAFERQPFVDRSYEEAVGASLHELIEPGERVGLALDDYGYFAVMAAHGDPGRFDVLMTHDPREKAKASDPLDDFKKSGGCYFATNPRRAQPGDVLIGKSDAVWSLYRSQTCADR